MDYLRALLPTRKARPQLDRPALQKVIWQSPHGDNNYRVNRHLPQNSPDRKSRYLRLRRCAFGAAKASPAWSCRLALKSCRAIPGEARRTHPAFVGAMKKAPDSLRFCPTRSADVQSMSAYAIQHCWHLPRMQVLRASPERNQTGWEQPDNYYPPAYRRASDIDQIVPAP